MRRKRNESDTDGPDFEPTHTIFNAHTDKPNQQQQQTTHKPKSFSIKVNGRVESSRRKEKNTSECHDEQNHFPILPLPFASRSPILIPIPIPIPIPKVATMHYNTLTETFTFTETITRTDIGTGTGTGTVTVTVTGIRTDEQVYRTSTYNIKEVNPHSHSHSHSHSLSLFTVAIAIAI
jgi:hypothetical protein